MQRLCKLRLASRGVDLLLVVQAVGSPRNRFQPGRLDSAAADYAFPIDALLDPAEGGARLLEQIVQQDTLPLADGPADLERRLIDAVAGLPVPRLLRGARQTGEFGGEIAL